jgi:hypothetical protein
VPESATHGQHDRNGSCNARHCHNPFVITTFISRRTAAAQHFPQRLGTPTRNATATEEKNAPDPGARGALELPAAGAMNEKGTLAISSASALVDESPVVARLCQLAHPVPWGCRDLPEGHRESSKAKPCRDSTVVP